MFLGRFRNFDPTHRFWSSLSLYVCVFLHQNRSVTQVDKYAEENALRAKLGIKPLRDE